MAVALKPPLRDSRPPEAGPRFPKRPLVEIREAKTPKESEGFWRVALKVFAKEYGWDRKKIEELDAYQDGHRRFVACLLEEEPGRVVGTGMLAFNRWKGKHVFMRLAVEEEFRSKGISPAIWERLAAEAREMDLKEIFAFCFASAFPYHEKSGWKLVENLGKANGDKEDGYFIRKEL